MKDRESPILKFLYCLLFLNRGNHNFKSIPSIFVVDFEFISWILLNVIRGSGYLWFFYSGQPTSTAVVVPSVVTSTTTAQVSPPKKSRMPPDPNRIPKYHDERLPQGKYLDFFIETAMNTFRQTNRKLSSRF